jgi:hypothetical protein
MGKIIPNSGKPITLRNKHTGAAWLAYFDYMRSVYCFEPCGNLRAIKSAFESPGIPPQFEPAGTR